MIHFKLDTPIVDLVDQIKKDMVFSFFYDSHAPIELCELYAEVVKYCQVHLQHAKESGRMHVPFLSRSRFINADYEAIPRRPNFDKSQLVFDVGFDWRIDNEKKSEIHELCFSHQINFDFDLFNANFYDSELSKKISLLEMKIERQCRSLDDNYEYPDNLEKIAEYMKDLADKKFSIDDYFRHLDNRGFL